MLGKLIDIVVLEDVINPPTEPLTEEQQKRLKVKLSIELKIILNDNKVDVVVDCSIFDDTITYSKTRVSNLFSVPDVGEKLFINTKGNRLLIDLVKNEKARISKQFASTLAEAAISQTRAVHAMNIKGTTISSLHIPFIESRILNQKKSIITLETNKVEQE